MGEKPQVDERSDASVVTQFFLLPLAVVAGLVGIFLIFILATSHPPTARDHLRVLRTGRFNQRWQAAFDLSNLLRDGRVVRENPSLVQDLVGVFRAARLEDGSDPRVRRYLALALGNSGSRQALPALRDGLADEDAETRMYCYWGLTRLAPAEAGDAFKSGLRDIDPSVRSICAYALGLLPGQEGTEDLRLALEDSVEEVRWNAALALARHGDPGGKPILLALLDRKYLDRFTSLDPEEKASVVLNSLRAIKFLKISNLDAKLRDLAISDPDPRVREAARTWESAPPP